MILKAKWILPITSPAIAEGAIKIKNGIICDIGYHKDIIKKHNYETILNFDNCLLMPGIINAHSHIAYTAFENSLNRLPFIEWIKTLTYIKHTILTDNDYQVSSLMGILKFLKNGITTIADTCDSIIPFLTAKKIGIRIIFFVELFGWQKRIAKENISTTLNIINSIKRECNNLQTIGISPHSPYTVSPFLLNHLAKKLKENKLPICMHVAESKSEHKFFTKKQGDLALLMKGKKRYLPHTYSSTLSYLATTDFLQLTPILIHGSYILNNDLQILKKNNLSIIFCPSSNSYFKNRPAPLHLFSKNNINWGIGTDSTASNHCIDMFEEIKLIKKITKFNFITPKMLIQKITTGNATILNLNNKIGSLENGKDADIIAIKINKKINDEEDLYSILTNEINSSNVVFTMIKGRILYHNNCFKIKILNNFNNDYISLRNKIKKECEIFTHLKS